MPTTIDIESQRMLLGSTPVRKIYQGPNLLGARIAELFTPATPGVWYDPSDFSTLFQDAAGTIPVTGVEQPVGRMLDKSGRGNHASQATTAARPILSARYNLLASTEDCNRAWSLVSVSGSNVTCPDGRPGILITNINTTTSAHARQGLGNSIAGATYSCQVAIYAGSTNSVSVGIGVTDDGSGPWGGTNTSVTKISGPGSVSSPFGLGVVTALSSTVPTVVRVQRKYVSSVAASVFVYPGTHNSSTPGHSVIVQDVDCRFDFDRINLPSYQRVGNLTTNPADYDAAGFSPYLRFDGVDDFLDAGTLDFSSATQSAAVIGIKKLSDAIDARPYSHGLSTGQNGAFRFLAPANPGQASVRAVSRGADGVSQETGGTNDKAAPIKLVLCSTYGANAPVSIRYNGTDSRVSPGSLGALTLPSARAVIGAQVTGETTQSIFFRGRIYGLAHIARALSPVEQRILEQFLRNKSRAY